MPRLILSLLLGLALAGCGRLPSLPGTGGDRPATALAFETELLALEGSDGFRVAVEDRGAPLAATRESVRFQATRYCLRQAGSSEIAWVAAPQDPGAWRAVRDGRGRLVYTGRCTGR